MTTVKFPVSCGEVKLGLAGRPRSVAVGPVDPAEYEIDGAEDAVEVSVRAPFVEFTDAVKPEMCALVI